jgi:hypothetical protein
MEGQHMMTSAERMRALRERRRRGLRKLRIEVAPAGGCSPARLEDQREELRCAPG